MFSPKPRYTGRAIAQAVSRWLPTAAVRGSRPGRHVGFCGGQSGPGAGFLRVLRFPLPNSFHQLLQKIIFTTIINQSSGICTIGQMGKRLRPQYKGLIDTYGLETKIPRDSGPLQTDRQTDRPRYTFIKMHGITLQRLIILMIVPSCI
jgi:hypothetical protein